MLVLRDSQKSQGRLSGMNISFGLPQSIFLTICVGYLAWQIVNHGKSRTPYHAGAAFLNIGIEIALLYWGGFFS